MESFVYLGAKVDNQVGTVSDIRKRKGKARANFNKLNKMWKSRLLRQKTKFTKTNVIVVLLYGCETWRMTKEDEYKLNVMQDKCQREIQKIYRPTKVSNEEIGERSGMTEVLMSK